MHTMTLFLPLLFVACGGNGSKSDDTGSASGDSGSTGTEPADPVVPDCSWFSGDNCWKQAVRAADACLPSARDLGTFASNFQTCSFTDSSELTLSGSEDFSSPFAWSSLDIKGFSLVDDTGATCINYLAEQTDSALSWTVGTSEGAVTYAVPDLLSYGGLLTCPDGTVYDLGTDVMSCPDANAHWPFISHAATGTFLNYSLQGGDEAIEVFTCTSG
jgi:hypothetical protein